jgi:fibronectin-binding autotransporter adhesin
VVDGTINTNTLTGTALTFSGTDPVISASTTNSALAITSNGSGNLTLDAGGTGLVQIGNTSTGDVELAGGYQDTGCTVENATGNLICTGDVTAGGVLLRNYWVRDDDTQTLTTATDWDNLTLGGLLTATGGATLTGALNINTTGSSATNIGTGTYEGTITIGNATTSDLSLVDPHWSITGAGVASFDSLSVGGGYGDTGVTITTAGNISANGNLVVDGTINTNTLTGTALTFSGTDPVISASTTNSALAITSDGSGNLTLDAGGTGLVQIGNTSTGDVELAGGYQDTGCTVENATGNLICTGDVTAGGVLLRNYWVRDDDTQTLTTATDWDNLTLGGLLTATGGATLTGALNINTTGSSATNIGTGIICRNNNHRQCDDLRPFPG